MASEETGFRPTYEIVKKKDRISTIQKRLIVCCDGTWFASDKGTQNLPSNVARIGRLIANEGTAYTNKPGEPSKTAQVPQIVYYQSGVGTGDLTWVDKHVQGAFGHGLDEAVCSAYSFLCSNYANGDEIFLFGFSRGAYTARALAGLILAAGFIPPGSMTEFYGMYQAYKKRDSGSTFQDTAWWKENADKLGIWYKHTCVKFVGVWDTVGSLGLPESILSQMTNWNKSHQFYDTELSDRIHKAAHALALDEYRGTFSPSMWYHHQGTNGEYASELIQCWFPGYHSHIGGGTVSGLEDESSIDDITLAWMVDQVGTALSFDEVEIKKFLDEQSAANAHKWGEGHLTDSASYAYAVPGAGGWKARTPGEYKFTAQKPETSRYHTHEYIHPSVRYRMGRMSEKPKELGTKPGWFGGKNPIQKYEPWALKGFSASVPDQSYNLRWTKPAPKKGEIDIVIKEYKILPEWRGTWQDCVGLERMFVPSRIMQELDLVNNFGKDNFLSQPATPVPR